MSTAERRVPRAPSPPSAGRTAGIIALTWAVAIAFVLTVASDTRIGPVVYRFTKTHGVHLGDVYATLGCAAVAALITVWAVMDHRNRARRFRTYEARRAQYLAEAELHEDGLYTEGDLAEEETEYFDSGLVDTPDPDAQPTQEIPRGRHALDD